MSFADAYSKRRRVLIEITPSLGARLRLWIHKLRHPRHRWFAGRGTGATKPHPVRSLERSILTASRGQRCARPASALL